MITRTAALVVGVLLLAPAVSAGQTRFEIAAGTHYEGSRPPLTPGWVVSGGFEIDQQDFVVEASWRRRTATRTRRLFDEFGDEVNGLETSRSRYLFLTAGVRSRLTPGRRFSPFYQVLAGGYRTRFRTDYEWPASFDAEAANARCGGFVGERLVFPCTNLPYPEYEEQRFQGFLMQPGVGLDARVHRALGVRLVTDLFVFVNRERGMALAPRLSLRVVVGL